MSKEGTQTDPVKNSTMANFSGSYQLEKLEYVVIPVYC